MASTIQPNEHNPDSVIQVRGVSKHYGTLHAVDGVDLCVQRGEIFGLIGHNGAGKSTLFKMMLGLTVPTAGQILINGTAVDGRDFRQTRRQLGYLPENVVLYDNLSGLETLHFFAKLKGAPKQQCAAVLERVGLAHALQRPVREYSKGMRQRLGFAQALLGEPRVLFLDEPTSGLDPQAIRDFYAMLHTLRDSGVTMIITSHILAELQQRVDRLAILSGGKIQALGSVAQLREQANMPLLVQLRLADTADVGARQALAASVRQALGQIPGVECRDNPQGLALRCPRQAKMALLAACVGLGGCIADLSMQEPSLEDIFFGLSD